MLLFKSALKIPNYSHFNANTGSSFAAFLEGKIPPNNVKIILKKIKIIPDVGSNTALIFTPLASDAII